MKKLENFYKNLNIILIVVVLSIEGIIIEKFKESRQESETLALLLGIVLLVLIFKFLGLAVEKIVERSERIRELILGEDYIEGTWFDMIEIEGEKYYGLYTNFYKDGEILQNGDQISADGVPTNSWKTIASQYDNGTLTMIYQVNYFEVNRVEQPYGILSISYSKTLAHKAPVAFTGTYYEMTKEFTTNSFRGFKIKNKNTLKKLNDPAKRTEAIKELIASSTF